MGMKELKELLVTLQTEENTYKNNNFYSGKMVNLQLYNLYKYLRVMEKHQPEVLFLGEHAHYARELRTGIPFTSEHTIIKGNDRHGVLQKGMYKIMGIRKDQFSMVLWEQVNKLDKPPLMWNLFPFSPTQSDEDTRGLSIKEIEWGSDLLTCLISAFPSLSKIVFIGNEMKYKHIDFPMDVQFINNPNPNKPLKFIEEFNGYFQIQKYQAVKNG